MQRKGNFKYLYTAQKIGAGAFGKVYELESRRGVQTPQVAKKVKKKISVDPDAKPHVREALKKSDAKHKRTAELSVVNEFEVLRDLNPDGKIVGIVECPSNPSGGVYYAHRYKDNIRKLDYEAFDSLPKSNRLELVFQLVQGLQYLHEKGYVHGDIKPENCLYDVNAEGVLNQMVLADFGGVRPVKEWGFGLVPAGTTVYRDPDFRSETNQLLNDKRQDFFRANDVYALSLTICNVLIPNHVKGKLPEDELLELGYSKQVVDALLSAMVDYKERPNIDTFAKEFRKAIAAQKQLDANHV
jgi:serine/threonine protein kinase